MLDDLEPLGPCPYGEDGQHAGTVIVPAKSKGDVTVVCCSCFAVRRLPAEGSLVKPLDAMDAAVIARAAKR